MAGNSVVSNARMRLKAEFSASRVAGAAKATAAAARPISGLRSFQAAMAAAVRRAIAGLGDEGSARSRSAAQVSTSAGAWGSRPRRTKLGSPGSGTQHSPSRETARNAASMPSTRSRWTPVGSRSAKPAATTSARRRRPSPLPDAGTDFMAHSFGVSPGASTKDGSLHAESGSFLHEGLQDANRLSIAWPKLGTEGREEAGNARCPHRRLRGRRGRRDRSPEGACREMGVDEADELFEAHAPPRLA